MRVANLFFFIFILNVCGCATLSDEISLDKVTAKQRVYIGRLNVKLNSDEAPKCEIYLNYDLVPSIQLSPDGFVFYKTDRENLTLKKIACLHKSSQKLSAWHHQILPLTTIVRPAESLEITYFGDIKLNWAIDPNETVLAAQNDNESKTPNKIGRVISSGEIKAEILDKQPEVKEHFFSKNPEAFKREFKVKTHLIEIKKD